MFSTHSHIFKAYDQMELILNKKNNTCLRMRCTTDIDCYVHFIVTCRYYIFFYEPCNFDKKFTKMNAMSDFERHNTGGHSLFNFVAKNKSHLTTSLSNHV